jgi:exoribonuclease-2
VDLINQRQLLAILREEPAPYPKGSGELFAAMRDFDVTYNAYLAFQDRMERYWCLRWLEQEQISEIDAVVLRDGVTVRFDGLPFFSKNVIGLPELTPGRKIRLLLGGIDYLGLEIEVRFISVATDGVEVLSDTDEEDYQTEAAEPIVEEQFADAPAAPTPTDNANSAPEAV